MIEPPTANVATENSGRQWSGLVWSGLVWRNAAGGCMAKGNHSHPIVRSFNFDRNLRGGSACGKHPGNRTSCRSCNVHIN